MSISAIQKPVSNLVDLRYVQLIAFSEGLSIDETAEIFIDGFGIEKAHQMLREKRAFAAELYAGRAWVWIRTKLATDNWIPSDEYEECCKDDGSS